MSSIPCALRGAEIRAAELNGTAPDPRAEISLAAARQIDGVCERFERALRNGDSQTIEGCLAGFGGMQRAVLLRELLAIELEYGTRCGNSPSQEEYLARFSGDSETVNLAFAELEAAEVELFSRDRDPAAVPSFLLEHSRYRVIKFLGCGGMGSIFLAEQRALERNVALKVIRPELLADAAVVERFRQEVKAAASLNHPNIVSVFDAETAGDGHFLVMEYIEGVDLARLVHQRGPLPVLLACDYIRQAALGLQHAFELGMVHRDITPRNLMLTGGGRIKVLDFGLAHFVSRSLLADHSAGRGMVLGSIDYMAPEQAANPAAADHRADIYSLGSTLCFLLIGNPQAVSAVLPDEVRDKIPAELAAALNRMLAKDPAARFQSPAEVATALEPFIEPPISRSPAKHPLARYAAALAIAALFLFGLVGLARRGDPSRPAVPAVEASPEQTEAVRLYREGLHLLGQRTESQVRLAIARLEAATKLDPDLPLAQTALADAYNLCGDYGWAMADDVFPKALAAARQAIARDANLAEAHLALAFVLHAYQCDWPGAEAEYRRAIEPSPRLPAAHHWYAWFLAERGRAAEADREIRLARQLVPDDPIIVCNVGKLRYLAHDFSGAAHELRSALELDPDFRKPHRDLGLVYAEMGKLDDALLEFRQAQGLTADSRDTRSAEAYAYARNGQAAKARELLAPLESLADQKPLAYEIATVYAALDEKDRALQWLRRAFKEHSAARAGAAVDPRLDGLQGDARLDALLKALARKQ